MPCVVLFIYAVVRRARTCLFPSLASTIDRKPPLTLVALDANHILLSWVGVAGLGLRWKAPTQDTVVWSVLLSAALLCRGKQTSDLDHLAKVSSIRHVPFARPAASSTRPRDLSSCRFGPWKLRGRNLWEQISPPFDEL